MRCTERCLRANKTYLILRNLDFVKCRLLLSPPPQNKNKKHAHKKPAESKPLVMSQGIWTFSKCTRWESLFMFGTMAFKTCTFILFCPSRSQSQHCCCRSWRRDKPLGPLRPGFRWDTEEQGSSCSPWANPNGRGISFRHEFTALELVARTAMERKITCKRYYTGTFHGMCWLNTYS